MLRFSALRFLCLYCVGIGVLLLQVHKEAVAQAFPVKGGGAGEAVVKYRELQRNLDQGWNTWDVNSMTTNVLVLKGLSIHVDS